jgi:ABC-type multidrug transport system fused ATPase/permease subunit
VEEAPLHHLFIRFSKTSAMAIEKEKVLENNLVIAGGLLVFYFVFDIKLLIVIALAVIILTVLSDFIAGKISWVWMKLAEVLGYINSKILLSVIFYVVLFPIAMIYRLLSKDTMTLKRTKLESMFVDRNKTYSAEDLKDLW